MVNVYYFCQSHPEDNFHVLVQYPFTKQIWQKSICGWVDLSCTNLVEWWDKFLKSFDLETSSMTASILWALWNSINSLVWDGKHAIVDEVLYSATSIFI